MKVDGCRFGNFSWKARNCFVAAANCFTAFGGKDLLTARPGKQKGPRGERGTLVEVELADALPGLAAAEHAAEGATLDTQAVRAAHRDRRVVVATGVWIVNAADPLAIGRLHVDQDAFIGLDRIAAKVLAALLDAHIALVLL